MNLAARFEEGLPYGEFLRKYADTVQRRRWDKFHAGITLADAQKQLLQSFRREMKVLVVAGTWCGDCVRQCPIFDHFASQSERIRIRYFDRDDHPDLSAELATCGGDRVPAVLFASEDNFPCGRYGDRTLARYRQMIEEQAGPSCPTGLIEPTRPLLDAVVQDWLDEFERIQWMLQTSPRLRRLDGD